MTKAAREWGPDRLSLNEDRAIKQALTRGEYWLARLLEREARGRFVHATVEARFKGRLRFNHQGVDVTEIENERLELVDKEAHYFLGPNLTLTNCTLVLKVSARRLFFDGARFINCTFDVKQELKNHQQWLAASLNGCRFKGRLSGCDFGYWPEYSDLPGYQHGAIEDCDFTEARLDGCRIMGSDPSTLRFPKWPGFTLLDPIQRAAELRGIQWPGQFGPMLIEHLHSQPARTRAIALSATLEAQRSDTTPEAFRAAVAGLDCVLY